MKCHPLRWVWGLIPLAVFSWLAALSIKEPVERDLRARVSEVLGNANLGWAKLRFDGRDGILSGQANEEDEPSKALLLGNSVYGVRILDGQADLLRKVQPYTWGALHSDNKVVLTGYVPNQTAKKGVLAAVKSQFPKAEVVDNLEFARGNPPAGEWLDGVKFGLKQLAHLKRGSAELSGLDISLSGEAGNAAVYRDVKTALTNLPKPLKLAADKVTAPVVQSYSWMAKLSGNSVALTGYVPSDRLRETLLAHAKQAFGKTGVVDKMELGEGAPNGWEMAAKVSLDQLATLQEGTAELKGGQLTLSGTAVDDATAEATKKAFKSQIPQSYKATEAIKGLKPVISPYGTNILATASAVDVTGHVPNDVARAQLIAAIKQRLPGRTVNDRLVIGAGEPAHYDVCILSAVTGLGRLGAGKVALLDKQVELTGATEDEALAQALPGEVRAGAKGFCDTKVAVLLDDSKKRSVAAESAKREAETAAQAKLEAERAAGEAKRLAALAEADKAKNAATASVCEGDLRNAQNAGSIQFERASDVILRASMPMVRKLAGIAAKCENVLIEIEGHTDSEGVPERNQPLSERRAQSVVNFLVDQGISADRIKAVGYGDTKPIALNDTAENRAKNRRIEFTVKTK